MQVKIPSCEKVLLSQLQSGDEKAFEQLYRTYSLQIFKKLLRLVKQEEIAEELLQDIFLKIWEKREIIDPDKSFRAYLYRIAQNMVVDLYRRAAYDRKLLEHLVVSTTELHNPIEDALDLKSSTDIFQQAMCSLSPQRRKIYTLCKIEGKSYDEVSRLLGVSASTISDHIVKANKLLRKHFTSNEMAATILVACALSL